MVFFIFSPDTSLKFICLFYQELLSFHSFFLDCLTPCKTSTVFEGEVLLVLIDSTLIAPCFIPHCLNSLIDFLLLVFPFVSLYIFYPVQLWVSYLCFSFQSAIVIKIFCDVLVFYQTFISPKVKPRAIITHKYDIYELPHELSSHLRLRILRN